MQHPGDRQAPRLSLSQRLLLRLLRLFFKLLYHQLAFTYDWVAAIVSVGMWQTWVASVLPYLDGPDVLEVGFGPGHLQLQLQRKGIRGFGIDESRQMARIARQRMLHSGLSARLIRGDVSCLPFKDECYQQVVMTFPAEFLFNMATYAEIRRVLRPGGKAVLLPLAWITGRRPLERLAAWLNRITGEAPAWNEKVLEPLKALGFDISWDMLEMPTSRVLIVQLSKPRANHQD